MLFVIELLFLAAGIWAFVSGHLPVGLLRLLFGKGEYVLPVKWTRWFGLLLASPLPVTALATFLIAAVAGPRSSGAAVLFEYLYLMAVIITTVVVARKMRRPPVGALLQAGPMGGAAAHRPRGYAATLLVLFGLAVLSCMAFGGIGILYMALDASLAGDPPPDALPLLLPTLIIAVAVAGGLQLLKLLRE